MCKFSYFGRWISVSSNYWATLEPFLSPESGPSLVLFAIDWPNSNDLSEWFGRNSLSVGQTRNQRRWSKSANSGSVNRPKTSELFELLMILFGIGILFQCPSSSITRLWIFRLKSHLSVNWPWRLYDKVFTSWCIQLTKHPCSTSKAGTIKRRRC